MHARLATRLLHINAIHCTLVVCVRLREQGVEIIVSAMEHHVHDANVLLAAWQARLPKGKLLDLSIGSQKRTARRKGAQSTQTEHSIAGPQTTHDR